MESALFVHTRAMWDTHRLPKWGSCFDNEMMVADSWKKHFSNHDQCSHLECMMQNICHLDVLEQSFYESPLYQIHYDLTIILLTWSFNFHPCHVIPQKQKTLASPLGGLLNKNTRFFSSHHYWFEKTTFFQTQNDDHMLKSWLLNNLLHLSKTPYKNVYKLCRTCCLSES